MLVMAVVLPFLTAFLIRIYAWINILQREGLLNDALLALGIVREPVVWLATDTAIFIGIVYSYLPFMVLPLYASLEKMDETLLEAAADLGCAALEGVLAGHRAAVGAGHRRRRAVVLHSDRRRVRHPRSARRLGRADDRADAVDRVLPEQGLAGGVRGRRRAARRPAGADRDLSASADARAGGALMRKASLFNVTSVALGLAFLYLPIVILVIYSFNASRLVTVWGGWSTRWYVALLARRRHARRRLDQPADRRAIGDGGDVCSARSPRWCWSAPAASAAARCFRGWCMRRW